ncbi:MAG: hypothetical protein MHPDNHAH_02769 [Anaerolineales bacterium]|nr:hypothetical protein [Anaerolineales bacterium]
MNSQSPIWIQTIQINSTEKGQTPLGERGLSKSGYHALFAARIMLKSFDELIEMKWGFSQDALLKEARDRQKIFVESHHYAENMGLIDPPDRRTLALRTIYEPGNPTLQILLLGKISAPNPVEARAQALDYWHEISSLFPYDYNLIPIQNQSTFAKISNYCFPITGKPYVSTCIEITRYEGILQSENTVLNAVGIWKSTLASNEKIWRILASSPSEVMLNITLRPTIVYEDELSMLAQIIEMSGTIAHDSKNPLTRQDAELINRLYLERFRRMGYVYLAQLHIVSPCKLPEYIPRAIGSALTHHRQEQSRELGYQMRRPQNKTELLQWLNSIYSLEPYLTPGIIKDARLQRLRYLVNTDEASALFQLPFPSKGGIPGVHFERQVEHS